MTELSVLPGGRFWTRCVPRIWLGGSLPPVSPPTLAVSSLLFLPGLAPVWLEAPTRRPSSAS